MLIYVLPCWFFLVEFFLSAIQILRGVAFCLWCQLQIFICLLTVLFMQNCFKFWMLCYPWAILDNSDIIKVKSSTFSSIFMFSSFFLHLKFYLELFCCTVWERDPTYFPPYVYPGVSTSLIEWFILLPTPSIHWFEMSSLYLCLF